MSAAEISSTTLYCQSASRRRIFGQVTWTMLMPPITNAAAVRSTAQARNSSVIVRTAQCGT